MTSTAVAFAIPGPEPPSYQTRPLSEYHLEFRELAERLFRGIAEHVPRQKLQEYDGSYSVLSARTATTLAKDCYYRGRHRQAEWRMA